jgi:hypothetical protein
VASVSPSATDTIPFDDGKLRQFVDWLDRNRQGNQGLKVVSEQFEYVVRIGYFSVKQVANQYIDAIYRCRRA